jgi:hypothetical protein
LRPKSVYTWMAKGRREKVEVGWVRRMLTPWFWPVRTRWELMLSMMRESEADCQPAGRLP